MRGGAKGEAHESDNDAHIVGHSNVWADIMGGGGTGEVVPDYDTFRKRYREFEHELEKPPATVRKLVGDGAACP